MAPLYAFYKLYYSHILLTNVTPFVIKITNCFDAYHQNAKASALNFVV